MRVGYTIEHLWGRVPGGTGVATIEVARALQGHPDVQLVGISGSHEAPPDSPWNPPLATVAAQSRTGAALYAGWVWANRPLAESTAGELDLVHATGLIPCPTRRPLVVTVHDLAFQRSPEAFSRWGRTLFRRSLSVIRRRADLVLCCSSATLDDCELAGIGRDRLRHVPLGVRTRVHDAHPPAVGSGAVPDGLPERFVLFLGTVEPRKNLARLVEAMSLLDERLPLLVVGAEGWGDRPPAYPQTDVRFLGFLPQAEVDALMETCTVFCYPSLWEGFGLPVLEAMAHGAAVVTSSGTSCAEVAGDAAVLVDPHDAADIARGIHDAMRRAPELRAAATARASEFTWERTAEATVAAYREVAR